MRALLFLFCLWPMAAFAQQPKLVNLRVRWDAYTMPTGTSNGVVVIWKQTSLGSVFTPWKPTAYTSSGRTNITISVLTPGLYHFYATIQGQPLPESAPSNVCTNAVP